MAKRRKTMIAGHLVKEVIYTAPEPNDSPRARAEKSRMTTAAQKALNDKAARNRLELLIATNFEGRDLWVTLTYRNQCLPRTREEAKENMRRFLRQLRAHRKARGQGLKYIYNTENRHGAGRFHHHIILDATERDIEVIRGLWIYGDVVDLKHVGDRDAATLAEYMTKEGIGGRPVGAQLWTASRNLARPVVFSCYVSNGETLDTPNGHIIEREEKQTEYGMYRYMKYQVNDQQVEALMADLGRFCRKRQKRAFVPYL